MSHAVTIALLGHLPSADNRKGLRSRDQDIVMESAGEFAARLAPAMPLLGAIGPIFRAVYAPATRRHVSSARVLTGLLGLPAPIVDARLNNVDYGAFKGRPLAETPRRADFVETPYPGGTSWSQIARQWHGFFSDRIRRHDGETVLLAGQSGAAPVMLAHICNGVSLAEALADDRLNVPFLDAGCPAVFRSVWVYQWQ
ncbi:histidine phosphatase family protein [Streptosporangium canum]|uniref:histidine phosphatase family protein n=1 Tax=Streptosporangium canum TaxID=324952 RepID=UPI003432C171